MKLVTTIVCTICTASMGDTVHWEYSLSSGGEDVHWVSPNATITDADQYEYTTDITYIGIDVVYIGIVWGPFDVTNNIDPKLRHSEGVEDGPVPIVLTDDLINADADGDGDIDITAHIFTQLNGKGRGQFDITNIYLGDVWVDFGWPIGNQEVQLDRIYVDGQMDITDIDFPCSEDTDGDGFVNVTDLLAVIDNWGGSGSGDVNSDGIVDVSDILAIVGAWGPC